MNIHGRLSCRTCFDDQPGNVIKQGRFQLVNDPGYWGASDPTVLVLGQSKGRNQWRPPEADFDAVAFAGIRPRLRAVLESVGIPIAQTEFDECFRAEERYIGFASLVRCSISLDGRSSGSPTTAALRRGSPVTWPRLCMSRWLTHLNPSLRLVVILGISDVYVRLVKRHLEQLHPVGYMTVNPTSVRAAGAMWTFAQHPSRAAGSHFTRWVHDPTIPKRQWTTAAVRIALSQTATPPDSRISAVSTVTARPRRRALQAFLGTESMLREDESLTCVKETDKMSSWRSSDGEVFALERPNGAIFVVDAPDLTDLPLDQRRYPASQLNQMVDGKPRYGRHSGLKSIQPLRDADLVRFQPSGSAEVQLLLDIVKARR